MAGTLNSMAEIPTACEEEELDAVQLLIVQAVEKYPELYDKGHRDYKKRVQKIRLWDKIAKELNIPGKIESTCFSLETLVK